MNSFLSIINLKVYFKLKRFLMKINEVAKILNIAPSAIRYYETRGLILSKRNPNGYRTYNEGSIEVLKLLIQAKNLGFTLNEIKTFSKALQENDLQKEKVNHAIENKIKEFDLKIKEFKILQKALKKILKSTCPLSDRYNQ